MAPGLAALDRSRCRTELYLSSIRLECQGTVYLPLTAPDEWRLGLIGFDEWQGIVPIGSDSWRERAPDDEVMARAVATLESLAPTLAGLARERCQAALCLRSIRESDDGGYTLPAEIIAAAAAGRLDVVLSIRSPPEDDDGHQREDGDDGVARADPTTNC
jgi:hypothetical protein